MIIALGISIVGLVLFEALRSKGENNALENRRIVRKHYRSLPKSSREKEEIAKSFPEEHFE